MIPDIDIDKCPVQFGKYKGRTPDEIADTDPSYIVWMWETFASPPCSARLAYLCRQDCDEDGEGWVLDDSLRPW